MACVQDHVTIQNFTIQTGEFSINRPTCYFSHDLKLLNIQTAYEL